MQTLVLIIRNLIRFYGGKSVKRTQSPAHEAAERTSADATAARTENNRRILIRK